MRIAIDAMGSDTNPEPELQAAAEAVRLFGDEIILVGPEEILKPRLQNLPGAVEKIQLVNATETITMQDKGLALALKAKRKGSKTTMALAMDLVKEGQADAILTAGNTGGVLATAYYRLGMIPGVERPVITGLFPVHGGACAVLDIGANPDVKPEHLVQFAVMGSVYTQAVRGVKNPRVALLSNGEEPGKGNELVKHTYPLLESSGLNFVGPVEAKEIFAGQADVVVTDGFSGNVFLKTSEAVSKMLLDILRAELMGSFRTKMGALLAKPAFGRVRKILDPAEIGAAPLLGVNGLVFKAHGRSDARAILNGIKTVRQAVDADLLKKIQVAIQEQIASLPADQLHPQEAASDFQPASRVEN
jgi:glycerol-3-phosphate acyltransferase PlsX